MAMTNEIFGVVTAWVSNGKGSLVLGIPKELREKRNIQEGRRFVVESDAHGRIIYVPKD